MSKNLGIRLALTVVAGFAAGLWAMTAWNFHVNSNVHPTSDGLINVCWMQFVRESSQKGLMIIAPAAFVATACALLFMIKKTTFVPISKPVSVLLFAAIATGAIAFSRSSISVFTFGPVAAPTGYQSGCPDGPALRAPVGDILS